MCVVFSSRLSALPNYYVPKDGGLPVYQQYISMLPNVDHPEVFGQHPNADITLQIQETRLLFDTLLHLAPQVVSGARDSKEDKVCCYDDEAFTFLQHVSYLI